MTYTSIKIKRRKTTLRGKPVSLFVQLICHRQTRRIPLDIRICEEEWNPHEEKLQIPADTGPSRNSYLLKGNEMLLKVRHKIGLLIMQLEKQGDYSVDDLLVAYQAQNRPHTLSGYIEYRAKELTEQKKTASAHHCRSLRNSFARFLSQKKKIAENFTLQAINEQIIIDYAGYLEALKLDPNTVSFYLRVLRSILNRTADDGLIERQPSLFRKVNTRIEKTEKRAVAPQVMQNIMHLDDKQLKNSATLRMAVDLFLFAYYAQGMAFIDIAYLTKNNIRGKYLVYVRRKTGQTLKVKILPVMQAIIERYQNEKWPYLFPVLKTQDASYKKYESALRLQNLRLKTIGEIVGTKLSTYIPRHTWASMAKTRGIPEELISEGMGHTSLETTHIYMTSLDDSRMDRVNEFVITGRISKGKKFWKDSVSW